MKKGIAIPSVLILLLSYSASYAVTYQARKAAADQLLTDHPLVKFHHESGRLTRLYGQSFGSGASPQGAAEQFKSRYAPIFGVESSELLPTSFVVQDGNSQPVMYLEEEGRYKFTIVYYSQFSDGIPVYRADLRLLVINEPGYPLVLASSALRDLGDFLRVDRSKAAISPQAVQQTFATQNPQYKEFTEPQQVIWVGIGDEKAEPSLGILFIATAPGPELDKSKFIIEPASGEILYKENMIYTVDVTGNVDGYATENFKAEQCGNEVLTDMPWARVYINGGNVAFADSVGHYVISNSGSSPVSVISYVRGHWFQVWNDAGTESFLTQTVTPPGPANFIHNPSNGANTRAEVNAYIHANLVRDFTLKYNPTYPGIYNDTDFPVHVNRTDGYCPGNAWYDNADYSINFCSTGDGYPNTAFSTIVHHEYGHHLVEMAGSGQEEYGEGMGDVMGLLITDDPGAAWGFFGSCTEALRNADNSIQYPCSGEIHYCGQLLSGCVWETRNELLLTNPSTYRNIIANLAINAMLLHSGYTITPSITIDYLTLDDNDGNIDNGTPHHNEICTGFGEHNMDCPVLDLLSFSYPGGLPEFIHPFGDTVRVVVSGAGGTPQPNTGQLHYNIGAGWVTIPMTQVSANVYDAIFPALTCRTAVDYYFSAQTTTGYTANDPVNAPTSYYSTISGTGLTVLFQDNFSTNLGWTGTGGTAEWTISAATGGAGGDSHGGPDPSVDHSSTSDNKVLGNDNNSGTGGDYNAGISSTQWVTSPIINCSGQTNILLSFWRWLGVELNDYDHAYFQVYNGSSWTTLFENGSLIIDDSSWKEQRYNVSTYANNNANFRIRFGLGSTDGSWQFCGWNIDDIKVTTAQCDTFRTGIIAGVISDINGAVSNAIVHAVSGGTSAWDTTAANGSYAMTVLQNTYSVSATHFDHRDTTVTGMVVTPNNTTTLNITMQRLPGAVKGTVTRGVSLPIANVRVAAVGSGKEDTTDAAGFYRINGLIDGVLSMFYTNPDYRDTTVTGVNITPGDTTTLNAVMQQLPGWIEGVVSDSVGSPIESVLVLINNASAVKSSGHESMPAGDEDREPIILAVDSIYTNSLGYYSSRLATGNYIISFSRDDFEDTTIAGIAVTPNDTTNVSPTLQRYNHPPVITSPATANATEGIPFSYIAMASDSDGVVPVISFGDYPAWMNALGDTITGIALNGNGNTSFRIFASDGYKADTLLVAVTVAAVNDPPIITSADIDTATEHQLFSYTTTATDPDNPTLNFNFESYPVWLTPSGATLSGTPPEGATNGSFVAIVSDGALGDSQLVNIVVLAVDDPPVITSPAAIAATEDIPLVYIAAAYDPEGAATSIAIDQLPVWLTVVGDTVSGTPLEGYTDTAFRIVASDGLLNDTAIVMVIVIPVNDAPVVTSADTATAVEDQLFSYTGTASDPDGTIPAINYINYPSWMAPTGVIISGTPPNGQGDTSFSVVASDETLADTMAVAVEVLPVNDPPEITSAATDIAIQGEPFVYICTAIDIDGPTPAINFANYASWLAPLGDTLSGIPPSGSQDTSFIAVAFDGSLSDTLIVSIDVQLPNNAPQIMSADNADATEDIPFNYIAAATDPDGTIPIISFLHIPSWMAVVGDTIAGIALEGFVDTSFTVIATDGALSDTLGVAVDVVPVNDPPVITSVSADTAEIGMPFYYLASAIDPDGTSPIISFARYPDWMSVSGDAIMGVPMAGSSDTSFMVSAYDGQYYDSLFVVVTVIGGCRYVPGDINGNGSANGIDVTFSVTYLKGGAAPPNECDCPPHGVLYVAGDVNGNCAFNGIDITFYVAFLKELQPALGWCDDCPPSGPAIVAPPDMRIPVFGR